MVSFRRAGAHCRAGAPEAHNMLGSNHQAGIGGELVSAYNRFNSQWKIQWLRTLRNRGAEKVPIRSKSRSADNSVGRLFLRSA
jgi:hypothetical protein